MKKQIVKFLARMGWWRLAYRVSPSLAGYYAATGIADALRQGMRDGQRQGAEKE